MCVSFRDRDGKLGSVTTAGSTLFAACSTALDFFGRDFWRDRSHDLKRFSGDGGDGRRKPLSQRNAVSLNAVHLIFSGEKTNSKQEVPNPALRPEHLSVHGVEVAVIPVLDLVSMKLVNNRDIDRVHIRDMDSVGLITADIEKALSPALHVKLGEIRHSL